MRTRIRKAFTLVEILIVVVILGILAAIVIPQFTSASEDAQLSAAQSQLQTIRNQIELYRVRNNGTYPALTADGDANTAWIDLITADYLRSAPVNPRTGTATLVIGSDPGAHVVQGDAGWWFDVGAVPPAQVFGCNGYDEATGTWIP